jgi:hypothetical protein
MVEILLVDRRTPLANRNDFLLCTRLTEQASWHDLIDWFNRIISP